MTDSITARFYVSEITRFPGVSNGRIKFSASTRGDQNKAWAQATPSGTIEMYVNNPVALEWFDAQREAGRDVALTFEAVE